MVATSLVPWSPIVVCQCPTLQISLATHEPSHIFPTVLGTCNLQQGKNQPSYGVAVRLEGVRQLADSSSLVQIKHGLHLKLEHTSHTQCIQTQGKKIETSLLHVTVLYKTIPNQLSTHNMNVHSNSKIEIHTCCDALCNDNNSTIMVLIFQTEVSHPKSAIATPGQFVSQKKDSQLLNSRSANCTPRNSMHVQYSWNGTLTAVKQH